LDYVGRDFLQLHLADMGRSELDTISAGFKMHGGAFFRQLLKPNVRAVVKGTVRRQCAFGIVVIIDRPYFFFKFVRSHRRLSFTLLFRILFWRHPGSRFRIHFAGQGVEYQNADAERKKILFGSRWDNFRFDDTCDYIVWVFDALGNLVESEYDRFVLKPGDEAEGAGTRYKVGDFVLAPSYYSGIPRSEDVVYVVIAAPGKRPPVGTWGNDYLVFDTDGPRGHFHPHETEIEPFEGEVPPDSPLWFWRDYARGLVDKEAEISIGDKKMTLKSAISDDEISFHEGISWREFLKKKNGEEK